MRLFFEAVEKQLFDKEDIPDCRLTIAGGDLPGFPGCTVVFSFILQEEPFVVVTLEHGLSGVSVYMSAFDRFHQ